MDLITGNDTKEYSDPKADLKSIIKDTTQKMSEYRNYIEHHQKNERLNEHLKKHLQVYRYYITNYENSVELLTSSIEKARGYLEKSQGSTASSVPLREIVMPISDISFIYDTYVVLSCLVNRGETKTFLQGIGPFHAAIGTKFGKTIPQTLAKARDQDATATEVELRRKKGGRIIAIYRNTHATD